MAKKSLADVAAAFQAKASGGGGGNQDWKLFFNFWKAPVESISVVRFLPDANEDNPMAFLVENLAHELNINGKREKVPCLKMYNEDCPICALSQKYYDEKDPEHNEQLGKKYYRKKSYIGQVMVVESPVEHNQEELIKLIEFGPKIFKQILSALGSGDLEENPYELKGGYNFRIKKTKSGEYADYGTSSFSPKQTDIGDDVIGSLNLYNLEEYRTARVSRDVLETMLLAEQTGGAMPTRNEAPPKVAKPTPQESKDGDDTPPAESVKTEAPAGEKKMSVVEQLRARAAAQKAKAEETAE